jgi:hypothetical protein
MWKKITALNLVAYLYLRGAMDSRVWTVTKKAMKMVAGMIYSKRKRRRTMKRLLLMRPGSIAK